MCLADTSMAASRSLLHHKKCARASRLLLARSSQKFVPIVVLINGQKILLYKQTLLLTFRNFSSLELSIASQILLIEI